MAACRVILSNSVFSRKGLIGQLEYEGYSTKDATHAVDPVGPTGTSRLQSPARTTSTPRASPAPGSLSSWGTRATPSSRRSTA